MAETSDQVLAVIADAVLALAREIEFRNEQEDVIPLGLNERLTLRMIDRSGGLSSSELASRLGLQRSNLSTALRGLEEKGLISRSEDGHDGRGVIVASTPLAERNLAALHAHWVQMLADLVPEGADLDEVSRVTGAMAEGLIARRREVSDSRRSSRP